MLLTTEHVSPPERPVLPSSAVHGQAPTLATSPPTMRMVPLTTLLATTLDTPHVTGAGVVVVVVVVVAVEVVGDDMGLDVVVVFVGVDGVVVLVAQQSDISLPSNPQGLLMAVRR